MTEEGGSEVATEPKRAKDEACVAEQESSSEVRGDGQFGISARGGKKERREKQFDWSL